MQKAPWFADIASLLGYPKLSRIQDAPHITNDDLNEILKDCLTSDSAIFFLPDTFIEVGVYGISYHKFLGRGNSNYLTYWHQLDEKFLRRLFTGIEFLVYKLCFIIFEKQRHDYNFESAKTRSRMRKLIQDNELTLKITAELFDEIWFVRDAFAHSFMDVGEIRFRGNQLRHCFGVTHLGRAHVTDDVDRVDEFMTAIHGLVDPLVDLFIQRQTEQVDQNKFNRLADRLLKPRSLTR